MYSGRNSLIDAFRQAQLFNERQEAVEREEARMLAEQARAERAEQLKPQNIFVQAQTQGLESLDPQQRAVAQFYDQRRVGEMQADPITGAQVPKYKPVFGGLVDERTAQNTQPQMPRGVQGISRQPNEQDAFRSSPVVRMEEAKMQAKADFEAKQKKPKLVSQFRMLSDDIENIESTIDKAIGQVESGAGGKSSIFSFVPGTLERDFAATLSTIQADAAFGRLQEMRDSSPTGGALGQVSERELELLRNAKVALENSQSEAQLLENLERYRQARRNAFDNVAEAFKDTYGSYPEGFGQGGTMGGAINFEDLPD